MDMYDLYQICLAAGQEIMDEYSKDTAVDRKEDHSPLTEADRRAHRVIYDGLKQMASIPVLSEEGEDVPAEERQSWKRYWLVDPLDGTKEFLKKNDEFTVNISLIEGTYPTLGIIYAPALDTCYFGAKGHAFKLENASAQRAVDEAELLAASTPLPKEEPGRSVVASRSHLSDETEAFIEELTHEHGRIDTVAAGSSLKFCFVAEGRAAWYPRFAPTMEWDTAAGQAIVEASGGEVLDHETGERLAYTKENLTNNWFLAKR
ncbi:3'(2'),5'-bisphosphate nucleotidase CysQ [Alkalicoccus halolimnae]|uniref:3'(2'),5'-bisphosphate nucleotidase CysQ n=1 Tax=Alkalicoccus halolimnae TaxID=1667239 RepID=A0A5C7F8G3_9BACI|nr:3'(2'),5'-bisphosphate nucleotidase CysQ [Alkalicoccus halolimnae]TXF87001.1 3'(2'),5'-bisphosphate nucleotidase CysQ [Alkalicoccus halolimnae]